MLRRDSLSGSEAVAALLNPIACQTFLEHYWQREALIINRNDSAYHRGLLSIEEIDELLASTALPVSQVSLGSNAIGVPSSSYSEASYIRPGELIRYHKEGKTVILRAAHLWFPRLRTLCEYAQSYFHCETQANLYLTPGNSQSSYPHWDAHDILVIQITGSKKWRLHESYLKHPLPSYRFDAQRHKVGPENGEFTLHAGDTAYVPRGLVHNPIAAEYSAHVALGILVKTWADVIAMLFESLVLRDAELRSAIPVNYGNQNFDAARCLSAFPGIARKLGDTQEILTVLDRLSETLRHNSRPDTKHMLAQFVHGCSLTTESMVEVPGTFPPIINAKGKSVQIIFNGIELSVDASLEPALTSIANRGRLRVSEIPAHSDAHRLAIAEKLIGEGCLRIATESL